MQKIFNFFPLTVYKSTLSVSENEKNDMIEEVRLMEKKSKNLDYLICDKNGVIKTPYTTKDKTKNTYGILLLGNSVAMGEGLYGFNNEKTFASQLETSLSEKDTSIDVVNAAYSGFNTWQEHVEAFRYLNSEPFHDDLPYPDLIVSFGGIQDFWNFIRLLSKNDAKRKEYSFANSMMIDKNNIDYIIFIIPGLTMMSVIGQSFANSSSSIMQAKYLKFIDDYLIAPVSGFELSMSFIIGAILRGVINGILITVSYTHLTLPTSDLV